jgi:hypothetical protein
VSNTNYINEILMLSALPDDWDGLGALGMKDEIIQNTLTALNGIYDNGLMDVTPNFNGTISVEWLEMPNGTRILLEVGLTTASLYIQRVGEETIYRSYKGLDVNPVVISGDINPYL